MQYLDLFNIFIREGGASVVMSVNTTPLTESFIGRSFYR